MKRAIIFSFICVLALLSGCARKTREITDRTLLPAGASLCGVNLSRVRMGSATAAIEQKLGEPQITLLLPGNSVHFRGSELGLRYDVRSALTALCQGEPCDGVALAADRTLLEARLSRFAEGYRTPPTNASVEINRLASEPFSYTDAVAGTAVDLPLLIQKILCATAAGDAGSIVVEVPLRTLDPEVTLADIQKYRQPIASYSTSFAKSPLNAKNRVHNLKKAAAAIHGTVLAPGEEFNCNAVLGDRNKENGWLEAAAIRNGSYVDEYGGGVCQVSSTLFNAVLMADLTVTERKPHSWPMGYIGIGRDATISTGGKNFRFVNSTEHEIVIGASVDEQTHTLTCTLYGMPPADGHTIRIVSEQTGSLEDVPEEYVLDESLPYNTRVTEREARRGKTSRTFKEYYDASGALIERIVAFEDVYRSIPARVSVSTDIYYS